VKKTLKHAYDLEPLEPRILLSGDAAGLVGAGVAGIVEVFDGSFEEEPESIASPSDDLFSEIIFEETEAEVEEESQEADTGSDLLSDEETEQESALDSENAAPLSLPAPTENSGQTASEDNAAGEGDVPGDVELSLLTLNSPNGPPEAGDAPLSDPAVGNLGGSVLYLTSLLSDYTSPLFVDTDVSVTSSSDLTSANVYFQTGGQGTDRLGVNGAVTGSSNGVSWSFTSGSLDFTGTATASVYQGLFRQITYWSTTPANPGSPSTDRVVRFSVENEDMNSAEADATVELAYVDAGVENILKGLGTVLQGFVTDLITNIPDYTEGMSGLDKYYAGIEDVTVVPFVQNTLRELLYPQALDGNGSATPNFGQTLQPAQIAEFLNIKSTLDAFADGAPTSLDGLSGQITSRLNQIATALGSTGTIQVDLTPSSHSVGFELVVSVEQEKFFGSFEMDLGTLEDDLNLRFPTSPTIQAGGRIDLDFTFTVDLSDHSFNNSDVVADNRTQLNLETFNAQAAFSFDSINVPIEVGMIRGSTVNMSGEMNVDFRALFNNADNRVRSLGTWQTNGSDLLSFQRGDSSINVSIPVTASLFGTTVTTANTELTVTDDDLFDDNAALYGVTDFEGLNAFAASTPEEVIQKILDVGGLYETLQNSGEDLFGLPVPFLSTDQIGELFQWATLFDRVIGSQIDVTDILLQTSGVDALQNLQSDPIFETDPLRAFTTNDALLRNQMRFSLVLNEDLSTYVEIDIPAAARFELQDLVDAINLQFQSQAGLYSGLQARIVSGTLTFYAASDSGITDLRLLPHPDAPADLVKFGLVQDDSLSLLQSGNSNLWKAALPLELPLLYDAQIRVQLGSTSQDITLARVAGEAYAAFVTRVQAAVNTAFGADQILITLVDAEGRDFNSVAATSPYYLQFSSDPSGDELTLSIVSQTAAAGITPLGFTTGDQASTPRPENLRTFQDFADAGIVLRTPDSTAYNASTRTVSLGYRVPVSAMDLVAAGLDLDFEFPTVSAVTPSGTVTVSFTPQAGLAFTLDLVLLPEIPVTFYSDPFTSTDLVTLTTDASFDLEFVLGETYTITVASGTTSENSHLQDLVGDLNEAFRTARRASDNASVDLLVNQFVARENFGQIVMSNAVRSTSAAGLTIANTNGVVAADQQFVFSVDGQQMILQLDSTLTSTFTDYGQLIGELNRALADVVIDANNNGVIDDGEVETSLTNTVFITTVGNTDSVFHIYSTGPPLASWSSKANIRTTSTNSFVTGLKFSGTENEGQVSLSATAIGIQANLRNFDAVTPFAQGSISYSIPSFSGTVNLGFNSVSFSGSSSSTFSINVEADLIGTQNLENLLSDPDEFFTRTLTPDPASMTLSLTGLSATGATISPTASIDFTISDFKAVIVPVWTDVGLPLPLIFAELDTNGDPTGVLTESTTVAFIYNSSKYLVTVDKADTQTNTSFADLVDDFTAAFTTAQEEFGDGSLATVDLSATFRFRADDIDIIAQVLAPGQNPDYVTVDILPDLDAFGAVGSQIGFSTQAVVNGLRYALDEFNLLFESDDSTFSQPLPILNRSLRDLWDISGDFAARISSLESNPASNPAALSAAIAAAFGVPLSQVSVAWDSLNTAYRINLQWVTGVVLSRLVDIDPATFRGLTVDEMDGLDRLVDGAGNSPATFEALVTFNINLGIDLRTADDPAYFLYEHDGGAELGLTDGTSVDVRFNVVATDLNFAANKQALGIFVRKGVAMLGGAPGTLGDDPVYVQVQDDNGTPYLTHNFLNSYASLEITLGNSSGKRYIGAATPSGETALSTSDFNESLSASVQVLLPVYTPTELINPFTNRVVEGVNIYDPGSMLVTPNSTGTFGGNVVELRILDLEQYYSDAAEIESASEARAQEIKESGNVTLFLPDPTLAGVQQPTLLDLLRDPAILIDGIDVLFGTIQSGFGFLGDLDIPLIGDTLDDVASGIFSFRDNWLREMRNAMRGAGESFAQLAKQAIFDTLGPEGAGILLQLNGIDSVDGIIQAASPDDVIFDFLDEDGNILTGMGGYGAHGFEFQIRLGSILLDTGIQVPFEFDALAPALELAVDGGFSFQIGWDLVIGFGVNLDDGFYVKVDEGNELEIRFDAGLLGPEEYFEVREVSGEAAANGGGTGYAIWNRRDNEWVRGPRKGDGSRDILYVLAVTSDGTPVQNLMLSLGFTGSLEECIHWLNQGGPGLAPQDVFWVVAQYDETAMEWVPAYLDELGQYRPQTTDNGFVSFDPDEMILFDQTAPFTGYGKLFFLRLDATDMIRRGLNPLGDADYAWDGNQLTSDQRNDPDDGVRRNNFLPSRVSGSIGINLFDPSSEEDDDESENRITWAELRDTGLRILELRLEIGVVANLNLVLSVAENAAFPRIRAEINLDWKATWVFAQGVENDPIDPIPEVGLNNIRLDIGSFLTDYLRPVLEEINDGLDPIRPVLEVLTARIPVISDIAGRTINLTYILYTFGGPKGKAIATFIEVVNLVAELSAIVSALPDDMNVYLPLGNIWLAKRGGKLGTTIYYDNNELTPPSFTQRNQSLIGDPEAAQDALEALNDSDEENLDQPGVEDEGKGGFGYPILTDPTQVFNLLLGNDAVLVTYSLPQLDFSFETSFPLVQIGPFQAGIRFEFNIEAQLHFGYDTYGIRKAIDTGNPVWALDGFYISDTDNADGSGEDVPEVSVDATIALYGGIDVYLARGGIEGGFTVTGTIDLNDPNRDGKIRVSELLAVVEWSGNPLDWFDLRITGEAYARYYFAVYVPVPYPFGVKRVKIAGGGKTFARVTVFDLSREGSDGPPILAEKITWTADDGTEIDNVLLINMGQNASNRLSNEDPHFNGSIGDVEDKSESFTIWNSGSTVTVRFDTFSSSYTKSFSNVSRVVAYGGEGDDVFDASGLNGIALYFDGGPGDDVISLGTASTTVMSELIGGEGDDTITAAGGYVSFSGVRGTNTINIGSGATAVNIVEAGRDMDTVNGGGSGANNTIRFNPFFGNIDVTGLQTTAAAALLDFSRTYSPLIGSLSRDDSTFNAGGNSMVTLDLADITSIRGGQGRDEWTFTAPETHSAGLSLYGGLGNDLFTFLGGDFSAVSSAGITIDDDMLPSVAATLGTIHRNGCGQITEIELADNGGGAGYIVAPEVVITDATGVGARATAALGLDGTIQGISVTSRGEGYSAAVNVTLVDRSSFNDTVVFKMGSDVTDPYDVNRVGDDHVLTKDGKVIRIDDNVENLTFTTPGSQATIGNIDLVGTLDLAAEQFVQSEKIYADTVKINTYQGFRVDYEIASRNNGNITLQVQGRGTRAEVTPTVSGGTVTGYTVTNPGSFYNFDPQVFTLDGSSDFGFGAFGIASVSNGQVTAITPISLGSTYTTIPVPDSYVTSPDSIYLNASLSSSAPGTLAGVGDGQGTITLRTLNGSVLTSADVIFPVNSDIIWNDGDFRFQENNTLDDIQTGGSGAQVVAQIDADGRISGFNILDGGTGYNTDFLPTVDIEGAGEATPIVSGGQIVGFNLVNPGSGYAVAPGVSIRSNGLSKVDDGGATQHIKAAKGFLVISSGQNVGNYRRPIQTDVDVLVANTTTSYDGHIYILENDGFDIGGLDGVNGVTTDSSDIHLVSFGGEINLGMPVQRTDSSGNLLWQNPEKTIPIYETYQVETVVNGRTFLPGDLVYVGGNLNAESGSIVLVADDFNVNSVVSSTGATVLSLRPSDPTAPLGLAGSRAIAEAIVTNGVVTGYNLIWGGKGYSSEPLVIFNAPGDRAFAVSQILNGAVNSITVDYGGSFYTAAPIVTLSAPDISGGTQATATATVVDGQVTEIIITNAGSGYTAPPTVTIALPGQQATARAQVNNGRISALFDLNGGTNYSFVPRLTIDQPFDFGLDQWEIDFFNDGFGRVDIGRDDGRNTVVTAIQSFQDNTVLRGDEHFFENTTVDGSLVVYGSGNTSYFDTGTTTADSITINDALIVNPNQTHTFIATLGGITFEAPGTVDGTLPDSTEESIILNAAGSINIFGDIGSTAALHDITITNATNITFRGSVYITGDLIIQDGAQVTFNDDVRILGNLVIGDSSDLTRIDSVTFTENSRVDVDGNIEIYTEGSVSFGNQVGNVSPSTSVNIISDGNIVFEEDLTAGDVTMFTGIGNDISLNQSVTVDSLDATAGDQITILQNVSVGSGNMTLTANNIEIAGTASITNQPTTTTVLTLKPFDPSRNIGVGGQMFASVIGLDYLHIDYDAMAAIGPGFQEVIFGDIINGTGLMVVANVGSKFGDPIPLPELLNPTTMVAGTVNVGYATGSFAPFPDVEVSVNMFPTADFLRFKSLVGDVNINATINFTPNLNPWVRVEAEQNIIINRPVYASDRISLTAGFTGGAGSVTINSTGTESGELITTSDALPGRKVEVSAGFTSGNISFNDDIGDTTITVFGDDSAIAMQAPGGFIDQNNGLFTAELLSLTAFGNIDLDLTAVDRVGAGSIGGDTLNSGSPILINGIIITGPGNLTMLETDDVTVDNVETTGGFIDISTVETNGGSVALGTLNAVSGYIQIDADASITDNLAGSNTVNLTTTGSARLFAHTGIGDVGNQDIDTLIGSLSASNETSGRIVIQERDGLESFGVIETKGGDGSIILDVDAGTLSVQHAISANGSGNILLNVDAGTLTVNESVSSTTGHITFKVSGSISLDSLAAVSTGAPGSVFLDSTTGNITLDALATITATGSTLRLEAPGDITLGLITALEASLNSGAGIYGAAAAALHAQVTRLRMIAAEGIGTIGTPLQINVENLSALSQGTGTTGIYLVEVDGLTVTQIPVTTVQEVSLTDTLSPVSDTSAQSDVTTLNNGNILLQGLAGDLVLNDGDSNGVAVDANGSGQIRIDSAQDILVNSDVLSDTGHITLLANRNIELASGVDVATAAPGTVYVATTSGFLLMAGDSNITITGTSSILIDTHTDATLGNLSATNVSVKAGEDIVNAVGSTLNVNASDLRLEALGSIGVATYYVTTSVGTLSARADTGSIYILESNAVTVASTTVTVSLVNADMTLSPVTHLEQSDLSTGLNGNIILVNLTGNITLNDGADMDGNAVEADGSGNIRIDARGSLIGNMDIRSGTGHITLFANSNIDLNAGVEVLTSTPGTIYIVANFGNLTMDGSVIVTAANSKIATSAFVDTFLGNLTANDVSVFSATGSIENSAGATKNVTATNLRLQANGDIGKVTRYITTNIDVLTARSVSGDIFVIEDNGLTIEDAPSNPVAIRVNSQDLSAPINSLNPTTPVVFLGQSDVVTNGSGHILIVVTQGDLTINDGADGDGIGVSADGERQVLLQALSGSVIVNADVDSDGGHISILGQVDVRFGADADVLTTGTGTIDIEASTGSILMQDDADQSTGSGNIRLFGKQDVQIGGAVTTSGTIIVIADTGSVVDVDNSGATDLNAPNLFIDAAIGIGSGSNPLETNVDRLSARATSGGIFIEEVNGLTVDGTGGSVNRVNDDLTLTTISSGTQSDIRTTSGDGSIVVRVIAGNLLLNDGANPADNTSISADGSGNILLESVAGSLTANADVVSGSGHISILSHTLLEFTSGADVSTSLTGTIDLLSVTDSILLSTSSNQTTGSGDIRMQAQVDITLGGLASTTGKISLTTLSGSILDGDGDGSLDLQSTGLRVNAALGFGEPTNPVESSVDVFSARAAGGGVFLEESNGLIISNVSATVQRVLPTGLPDPVNDLTQSDVRTISDNGSIVLRVITGDLVLNDGTAGLDQQSISADGSGNILLQSVAGLFTANADVLSGSGNISILSNGDLEFTSDADIRTTLTGSIDLLSETGSITLSTGSDQSTGSGDIRMQAQVNITLGGLANTSGNISLLSLIGSIIDGDSDGSLDLQATGLRVAAAIGFGAPNNHIETSLDFLTGRASSGGFFLEESNGLTVQDVGATINRVLNNASTTPVVDLDSSDVQILSGSGSIVLRLLDGNLVLNDGSAFLQGNSIVAEGSGNVLLEAVLGSVTGNANVLTGSGHISILAETHIEFTSSADIETSLAGSIDLWAKTGSITLSTFSDQITGSGDIRMMAHVDITLGGVASTTGNISLLATTGSILDSEAFSQADLQAGGLRIVAAVGIGTSTNAIETSVDRFSARAASGGIFVTELDGLTVDDVSAQVNRVQDDATTLSVTDMQQSDLRTLSGNGSIVVRVLNGDFVLNDGNNPGDNQVVVADGSGNILLETSSASITVHADVLSTSGNISILSQTGLELTANADIMTGLAATIDLLSKTGSVLLSTTSNQSTGSGDIRIQAQVDVTLGGLVSTTGSISLITITGSIFDADLDSGLDLQATGLRVHAAIGFGQANNSVESSVDTFSARASSGGVYLVESNGLAVDDVTVSVNRVLEAANTFSIVDPVQEDVLVTSSGNVVIFLTTGTLTLNDGTNADGIGVQVDGTGSVRLESSSAVQLNVDVVAANGNLSVVGATVTTAANSDLRTAAPGNIFINATSGAVLLDGSSEVVSTGGVVRVAATANVTLANLTATQVSVVSGASILNALGTTRNVTANEVRLQAVNQVGDPSRAITTDVDALTVDAGGSVTLTELDDASFSTISITTTFFNTDASTGTITDAAHHGVSAGGDVLLTSTTGTFLDGGDSEDDVRTTTGSIRFVTVTGLGSTGSGNIDVGGPTVSVESSGNGNIYLNLTENTDLSGIVPGGEGYLYLNVNGDLTLTNPITLSANSAAFITVSGALDIQSDISVGRDLRILANSIEQMTGTTLQSTRGHVLLRSATTLTMEAGAQVQALLGRVQLMSIGNLTVGLVHGELGVDLRTQGDLMGASTLRSTHEISGGGIRLAADGAILPVLTQADRLDVDAGAVSEVYELDDLVVGRFGLRLIGEAPGDTLTLRMNEAELTSYDGVAVVPGVGTFVWVSDENVTLGTRLVSDNGDIRVEVNGVQQSGSFTDPYVDAANGLVTVTVQGDAGTVGSNPITIRADEFTASSQTGQQAYSFTGSVNVTSEGITTASGSSAIQVDVLDDGITQNLTLSGRIVHAGNGSVIVNVPNGLLDIQGTGITSPIISTEGQLFLNLDQGHTLTGVSRLFLRSSLFSILTNSGNLTLDLQAAALNQAFIQNVQILGGVGDIDIISTNSLVVLGQLRNLGNGNLSLFATGTRFISMSNSGVIQNTTGVLSLSGADVEVSTIISNGTATSITARGAPSAVGGIFVKDGFSGTNVFADHVVRLNQTLGSLVGASNAYSLVRSPLRINNTSQVYQIGGGLLDTNVANFNYIDYVVGP